jgi:hypothetical protein
MKNRDELLERYWKGETSLEEEAQLREYFAEKPAQDEVSLLFSFFHEEGKRKLEREVKVRKLGRIVSMRSVLSIAASLLVVVASYFLLDPTLTNGNSSAKVVEDPNEALEVTLNALSILDGKLTKGQTTITEGIKHFDKTNIIKS